MMEFFTAPMFGQLLAAMIGTMTFSLLFGVPRQYYLPCGLIGMTGWGAYLLLDKITFNLFAVLLATMLVTLLSRCAAVVFRCPATLFLIPGIFPLVPGAKIYWTVFYVILDDLDLAIRSGYTAIMTVGALVLGIVFVFELPQRLFNRLVSANK